MKVTKTGKILRKTRIDNDERAQDMATRLGISPESLSHIETGRRRPQEKIVEKIVKEYRGDSRHIYNIWEAFVIDGGEFVIRLGEESKHLAKLYAQLKDQAPMIDPYKAYKIQNAINAIIKEES